jgi:hypothetical protein
LNDKIQDPLVGLACQQLICDGSMYHSPVPVQQIFVIPAIFSKHSKVIQAIHTSASVLFYVNILCRLVGDMKLTYLIVEQKTTSRFAAAFWYRHLLSRCHRREWGNELILSRAGDDSPGRFHNP